MLVRMLPIIHRQYTQNLSIFRAFNTNHTLFQKPSKFDRSSMPVLDEKDLEEQFVTGGGPGGQAVAKTFNCVVLRHKPTNIIVKCHKTRSLPQNRKEARKILITRLDNQINGEDSLESQKKQLEQKKIANAKQKRAKLTELKKQWKENVFPDKPSEKHTKIDTDSDNKT